MIYRIGLLSALLLMTGTPNQAQFAPFKTKLKARTADEFQAYAKNVEAELNARWNGKGSFLLINENAATRDRVINGELVVEAGVQPNPYLIYDGLVHDWYGVVFMPHTTLGRVLNILQDFDHHAGLYPQVVKSKLIKRSGDDITGYWRLEQKGEMLPAVFDVTQTVHYRKIAADKWVGVSHANDIRAVEDQGSKKEKDLPPGEGIGLMWKLYSYWTLQQVNDGVMAECRTVSLSRGVPGTVAWMIRPFINTVPRESMESTLRNTKKASGE